MYLLHLAESYIFWGKLGSSSPFRKSSYNTSYVPHLMMLFNFEIASVGRKGMFTIWTTVTTRQNKVLLVLCTVGNGVLELISVGLFELFDWQMPFRRCSLETFLLKGIAPGITLIFWPLTKMQQGSSWIHTVASHLLPECFE